MTEQGFMIPRDDPQTCQALVMNRPRSAKGHDLILTRRHSASGPTRRTTPEALFIPERRLPGFEQAMMQAASPRRPPPASDQMCQRRDTPDAPSSLPSRRRKAAMFPKLAAILSKRPDRHALENCT